MYMLAVSVSGLLLVACGISSRKLAIEGKWIPAETTWILLSTMLCVSALMYLVSPARSLTKNIALTAGVANNLLILNGVLKGKRLAGLWKKFTGLQKASMIGSGLALVYWAATVGRYPVRSYTAVQVVGLLAYVGTVQKLFTAKRVTEPMSLWVSVLLASLCAIYPAYVMNDLFAKIYLARAIPSVIIVIGLIARARRRERLSLLVIDGYAAALQTE
jgi:hypothetical protein